MPPDLMNSRRRTPRRPIIATTWPRGRAKRSMSRGCCLQRRGPNWRKRPRQGPGSRPSWRCLVDAKCARNTHMRTTDGPARSASSFQFFNQRPETDRIVRQHQRVGKRFQVLWQFAVGAGVHSGDDRGDCVHKIALAELIERLLLAPLDILVSGHIGYLARHFALPAIPPQQARSSLAAGPALIGGAPTTAPKPDQR